MFIELRNFINSMVDRVNTKELQNTEKDHLEFTSEEIEDLVWNLNKVQNQYVLHDIIAPFHRSESCGYYKSEFTIIVEDIVNHKLYRGTIFQHHWFRHVPYVGWQHSEFTQVKETRRTKSSKVYVKTSEE